MDPILVFGREKYAEMQAKKDEASAGPEGEKGEEK
jgi:hypothetical protein